MTQHDSLVTLRQMLDYARRAQSIGAGRSAAEIEENELLSLALPHALELVGEAAGRLSQEDRDRVPGVPWRQIIDMRNRLAHGYDSIDFDRVVQTVNDDLPPLIVALDRALTDWQRED